MKSIPYSDLGPFLKPKGPGIKIVIGFVPSFKSTLWWAFAERNPMYPGFLQNLPFLVVSQYPPLNIIVIYGHKWLCTPSPWSSADDHGEGVHNHLCPYITIILRGGYWETTKKGKFWRKPGYIGFRSANAHHRVDLKEGTKPMTIFIPGPFGLRKGPRSEYGIDFKTKKN